MTVEEFETDGLDDSDLGDDSPDEPGTDEAEVTYDIASYPSDLTVSVVKEMWDNGDIVVPEFQRNYVWSIRQASRLIESFLLGLPVPQVFLYVDEDNRSLVIDGQQRITSLVYFLEGYFGHESIQGKQTVFRLDGISTPAFRGRRFEDLEGTHQRKLKGSVLRAINIRQLSPRGDTTSIYHIFERLNTGGTPLKAQEIRNCVFRGPMVTLLRTLNQDSHWRSILGKTTFDRHQKDVELVLRVFAMWAYRDEYVKPLKEFLNKAMARNRNALSAAADEFGTRFPYVARTVVEQLGEKPFHLRGPLNSSALDTVMTVLMALGDSIPRDLKQRYDALRQDLAFQQSTFISTSDASVMSARFELAAKYIAG